MVDKLKFNNTIGLLIRNGFGIWSPPSILDALVVMSNLIIHGKDSVIQI